MPRLSAEHPQSNRTQFLRARCQHAEDEVRELRRECERLRAEAAAERAALIRWLDGPALKLDALEALQAVGREAAREMSTRHQSCTQCGGYRREMWDSLLEPAVAALRDTLGVSEPPADPPAWPVAQAGKYWRSHILRPFRTDAEQAERQRRGRQLQAEFARSDGLSGW